MFETLLKSADFFEGLAKAGYSVTAHLGSFDDNNNPTSISLIVFHDRQDGHDRSVLSQVRYPDKARTFKTVGAAFSMAKKLGFDKLIISNIQPGADYEG